MRANQVARYAGLEVCLTPSGSSVNRPGRLSKPGKDDRRHGMHMPSLSRVRFDPYAKAHDQALIGRGQKKMPALCAIQRKRLTGLCAGLKTNQPFDRRQLLAIEPETT